MYKQRLQNKLASLSKPDEVKTKWQDGKLLLDLSPLKTPLPKVSVVTITKDREHLFPLAIHNWTAFLYPHDSLEWIIVDDSKTDNLKKLIPIDNRIFYTHLPKPLSISDKRNYAVQQCSGDVIVNMDDDDIHFPDSILAKVRVLLTYPDKKCIFSLPMGIYNLQDGSSMISDSLGEMFPEGSMAFWKDFWIQGKFGTNPSQPSGEWYEFCKGRKDQLINLPFWFNFLACSHTQNTTKGRQPKKHNGPSFDTMLSSETMNLIRKIRSENDFKF
jgi:glycosyltransferase involved in cell wall biosynthesis